MEDAHIGGGEQYLINDLLKSRAVQKYTEKKTRAHSERQDWIDKFTKRINKDREGTKYKPLTYMAVSRKLEGTPTADMYWFWQECSRAKNFGAFFFWKLKK